MIILLAEAGELQRLGTITQSTIQSPPRSHSTITTQSRTAEELKIIPSYEFS